MRYVYIERRTDPEGKYWVIVDTRGRESGRTFRTKREAERFALEYGFTIVPPMKTGALR